MYCSRSSDLRRTCSSSRATCSSIVATWGGRRPRRPKSSRSRSLNAVSLLSSGSASRSAPRRVTRSGPPAVGNSTAGRRSGAARSGRPAGGVADAVLAVGQRGPIGRRTTRDAAFGTPSAVRHGTGRAPASRDDRSPEADRGPIDRPAAGPDDPIADRKVTNLEAVVRGRRSARRGAPFGTRPVQRPDLRLARRWSMAVAVPRTAIPTRSALRVPAPRHRDRPMQGLRALHPGLPPARALPSIRAS